LDLFWEQRVGGSNPSAPTITNHRYFKRYCRSRPRICFSPLQHRSRFCNYCYLRENSREFQLDFPMVNLPDCLREFLASHSRMLADRKLCLAKIPSGPIRSSFLRYKPATPRMLRLLFLLVIRSVRSRHDLLLENLALRQQLAVLERRQ